MKIIFFAVLFLTISLTFTQAASATVYQYEAVLDAGQEVPPNASTATGYGTFAFDSITKILDYTISFSGLSSAETGAHIHLADIGVDGPIQFTLPAGSPKTGSTTALSGAQETALYDGNLYVNIHSTNNAGGEIRGQLAEKKCLTCGDFNGDGYDDMAVGVYNESVGAVSSAGAVNIIYGSSAGLHRNLAVTNQFWTQDSVGIADAAEDSDFFGWSLSVGDFNMDGYDDLAVGVPYESVGAVAEAGAVNIIYGSSAGLHRNLAQANQLWTQDSVGIADAAESFDHFGSYLAIGDYNNDGYDDLTVGAYTEDVGVVSDAGAVNIIYGSSAGLHRNLAVANQFWNQDSTGIADAAEDGDLFGSSLSVGDFNNDGYDDLTVGAYAEDVGAVLYAGAVNTIYGSSAGLHRNLAHANQFWTQDSVGIADVAETDGFGSSLTSGDFNNDGYDDLAVGVSGETVGAVSSAGAVNVIYGSSAGLHRNLAQANQFWTQDSIGIADAAEASDLFGGALTSGDFNNDGYDDMAVGVDGEDVGAVNYAGAVNIIYGSSAGLHRNLAHANQLWTQDSVGINEVAEFGDSFGFSFTSADFNMDEYDDLAIGSYDSVGAVAEAGAVNVIYGSSAGLHRNLAQADQLWSQDSVGIADVAETNDDFGISLTTNQFPY